MVLGKYIQYSGEQLDLQDIVQSYFVFLCVDLKEKEENVLFLKDLFFFI